LSSVEDFHAFARACEGVEDWSLHERLVNEAKCLFPDDAFDYRYLYREALVAFSQGCWKDAFDILNVVRDRKPKVWPFPTEYYRYHAFIRLQILDVMSLDARIEKVNKLAFFKHPCLYSRQMAGLVFWVDSLSTAIPFVVAFKKSLKLLVSLLAQHDGNLTTCMGEPILNVLQDLAFLFRKEPGLMDEIPSAYKHFFARLFLLYGFCDLYRAFRLGFSREVDQWVVDDLAEDELVKRFFKICHGNESDHFNDIQTGLLFSKLQGEEERLAVDKIIALSELYQASSKASGYFGVFGDESDAFSAFIRGKTVAIVGPVDVGLQSGDEIDGFDIVIRFNPRPIVKFPKASFGSRTDVGYFSTVHLMSVGCVSENLTDINELRWAVVEELNKAGLQWLSKASIPVREHLRGWLFESPFLFGGPNAVQRVIMDILRFDPARIKIFNFNLYLTSNFSSGYADTAMNVFPVMAVHDPISNLIFTKKCVARWGVETDAVAEEILNMTPDEYMDAIVKQYARFVR